MTNQKTAVTLGSFDGLHKGHMKVIACAFEMQQKHGLLPLVLLFDSHPMLAVAGKAPDMILQPSLRDELIAQTGAGKRIVSFREVRDMSCRDFFEKILIEKLNAGGICCGWNYRFGKNNEGGIETLKMLCEENGVKLTVTSPVDYEGEPVSSTRIRRAIEGGEISLANAMLGR
ncbi:MAG: FAD synthetase family protein, partial [Clostridia bacterium]|nr:FAD synthetase family protein [Clostridia bacterium]